MGKDSGIKFDYIIIDEVNDQLNDEQRMVRFKKWLSRTFKSRLKK